MMYIDFNEYPFELVLTYSFKEDMINQKDYISDAIALTLNKDKPFLGLKGNKGLLATPEWWANVDNGNIPRMTFFGEIVRTYVAGQDNLNQDNSFSFLSERENMIMDESIYCSDKKNKILFKKRHFVVIVYAFDEMKASTPENPDFSHKVLEMAVSKYPIP